MKKLLIRLLQKLLFGLFLLFLAILVINIYIKQRLLILKKYVEIDLAQYKY